MTSSEITAIQTRARYLYAQNPSVTLSYASGNNGNLGAMTDTRKQASGFNQNAFYHAGLLGTQFAGASIGFTQQGESYIKNDDTSKSKVCLKKLFSTRSHSRCRKVRLHKIKKST